MAHCEIEIKYLIAMPDREFLRAQPGCAVWEIEQVYLTADPGMTRRVRRVLENGQERFYRTFKRPVSDMTSDEDEGLISREVYESYLTEADSEKKPILKTRYRIPYAGQVLEIDVYPLWSDRAVLEIELERESQQPVVPEWVKVLKDVTSDYRYKNSQLARQIPTDAL